MSSKSQQRLSARSNPTNPRSANTTRDDPMASLLRSNTVTVRSPVRRKRRATAGKLSLALAIVSVAVDASAFAVFMGGDSAFGFGICFAVIILTCIAAIIGFIAAVGGFGRWYGVLAVLVSFVANPVILVVVLVFIAPEALSALGS